MLARSTLIRALVLALAALFAMQAPVLAQEEEEDTEEETGAVGDAATVDPNQPSVYSGGRYTIVNFPISELDRTLLLVQGVLELRADLDIDMTKGVTFETWTVHLAGRYGLNDTLELQGGLDLDAVVPDMVDNGVAAFVAAEGSIMYDLMDWRVGLGLPISPDFRVNVFFGLPLKIRILKDRLAILALEKILTIHTHNVPDPDMPTEDTLKKPDLTLSLGFLVQLLKPLAVIVRGEVTSVGFEGDPVVRVGIDAQYTISSRMDLGLRLILKNLTKEEADDLDPMTSPGRVPLDERAISFFFRFRI